jgi:hypothetical protein
MAPEALMYLDTFTWLVVNMLAAAVRWIIETGAVVVTDKDYATLLRLTPVWMLFGSFYRLLVRRRWYEATCIFSLDYYFLYNRLTVFSARPLVFAEMIGNLALIALAISLMLPQRIDPKRRSKDDSSA